MIATLLYIFKLLLNLIATNKFAYIFNSISGFIILGIDLQSQIYRFKNHYILMEVLK